MPRSLQSHRSGAGLGRTRRVASAWCGRCGSSSAGAGSCSRSSWCCSPTPACCSVGGSATGCTTTKAEQRHHPHQRARRAGPGRPTCSRRGRDPSRAATSSAVVDARPAPTTPARRHDPLPDPRRRAGRRRRRTRWSPPSAPRCSSTAAGSPPTNQGADPSRSRPRRRAGDGHRVRPRRRRPAARPGRRPLRPGDLAARRSGRRSGIPVYGGFVDCRPRPRRPDRRSSRPSCPTSSNGPHFFYALQWWFFGLLALFGFGYLAWEEWRPAERERRRAQQPARTAGARREPSPDGGRASEGPHHAAVDRAASTPVTKDAAGRSRNAAARPNSSRLAVAAQRDRRARGRPGGARVAGRARRARRPARCRPGRAAAR